MTDTATIRVPRETRDLLGDIAREKGVSVSALVTEWALMIERREALRRGAEGRAGKGSAGDRPVRRWVGREQ